MKQTPPDNRQNLLDELDTLRGLLGDEARDVNLDDLPLLDDGVGDDGQIPLLQPATTPKPTAPAPAKKTPSATTPKPAAHSAIQAATQDVTPPVTHAAARPAPKTSPAAAPEQQSSGNRSNPFLKNAEDAIAARKAAEAAAPKLQFDGTQKATPALSETQINRLVDEVLKECLPHIEQTLRVHLNAALHRQNRNN